MQFYIICLVLFSVFQFSFSHSAHDILEQETRDFAEDLEQEAEKEAKEVMDDLVSTCFCVCVCVCGTRKTKNNSHEGLLQNLSENCQ